MQAAALTGILIVGYFLASSFVKDKKEEAEKILSDAKAEAEKMMSNAKSNIKSMEYDLLKLKEKLNLEKEELLKKEAELDNKAEKWKQQLSQLSLKLNYYSNFVSWCWKLIRNRDTDDADKIDSLKRKLHGLRR